MGGFFGGGRQDNSAQEEANRRAEQARQDADRRRREAEAESRRLTKEKDDLAKYRLDSKRRGRLGTILTSAEGLDEEDVIKKTLLGG
jgi:vacuolar-type H+-ATPase subunit H